jgi:hypothetical protein
MWRTVLMLVTCGGLAIAPHALPAAEQDAPAEIRLLVRSDDMGVARAVNEACIQSCRDGIARSVEVIVPGPWFLDAVRLLKENPAIDVGVHLTLTSEWERIKWRPLTHAPSLVDADGCFYPMTAQRKDWPPNTGFLDARPRPDEVERELRAQIELARKHLGKQVTHVSAHMGAATATKELREMTARLAKEYGLAIENQALARTPQWSGSHLPAEEREQRLVKLLEKLGPGQWLLIEHPGLDTGEMRAMGHQGYENVAEDRAGVLRAFTSERVRKIITDRRIRLISYADLKPR